MFLLRSIVLTTLFGALTVLSGCASKPLVFADFDGRHDFTKAQTFSWVEDPPMLKAGNYYVSPLAEKRLTQSIRNERVAKGYQFIDDVEKADFSVLYTMGARDKIEVRYYTARDYYRDRYDWGWGASYYPYYLHYPFGHGADYYEVPHMYTEGSIAVDIFNAATRQPIFHARTSKRLSNTDIDSDGMTAVEIIGELLADFPAVGCEPVVTEQCQPFKLDKTQH